jgi:hypothetical protein
MTGGFSPAEQGQLKDYQETVHVFKTNLPEPAALVLDGGKDVLLLVTAAMETGCHGLPGLRSTVGTMEVPEMVYKKLVKQFGSGL